MGPNGKHREADNLIFKAIYESCIETPCTSEEAIELLFEAVDGVKDELKSLIRALREEILRLSKENGVLRESYKSLNKLTAKYVQKYSKVKKEYANYRKHVEEIFDGHQVLMKPAKKHTRKAQRRSGK